MSPQLVDLDSDGNLDILSGSYAPGEIFFFKNRGDSTFARAKRLREKDNSVITVGAGTTAVAADWDNDGDKDIIVGTMSGDTFLITNIGSKTKPELAAPTPLQINGKPLHIAATYAAPAIADWDGDGLGDLLMGAADGSVVLYRATGRQTSGQSNFAAPQTLIPASTNADPNDLANQVRSRPWGGFIRVTVTDFNGDGRGDLLLGDTNVDLVVNDGLTPDQEKERIAADKEYYAAENAYRKVVTNVTGLSSMTKSDNPSSCDFSKDPKVVGAREKMEAAQENRTTYYRGYKPHGYVWLFARKPAAQAHANR